MPKIEIIERDETSAGVYAANTDVVYIPGLVDYSQNCLYSKGKYVGIKSNTPTLFTSVRAFESLCGKRGFTFAENQYYDEFTYVDGEGSAAVTTAAFDEDATPHHQIMFPKGSIDPSYVMAKELLAAGLNVVYEALNVPEVPSDEDFVKVSVDEAQESKMLTYFKVAKEYIEARPSDALWYNALTSKDFELDFSIVKDEDDKEIAGTFETNEIVLPISVTVGIHSNDGAVEIVCDDVENNVIPANTKFKLIVDMTNDDATEEDVKTKVELTPQGGAKVFVAGLNNNTVTATIPLGAIKTAYVYDDSIKYFKLEESTKEYTDITVSIIGESEDNSINLLVDGDSLSNYYKLASSPYVKYADKDKFEVDNCYTLNMTTNISDIYAKLSEVYALDGKNNLSDKGSVSVKYLTSGGYPTFECMNNSIATAMIALAEDRGDCVALIDHTNNPYRENNIDIEGSVYKTITDSNKSQAMWSEFAAMFTPWIEFSRTTIDKDDYSEAIKSEDKNPILGLKSIDLPGSYAYLITLADSIKTNANWLAVAGAARGVVKNIAAGGVKTEITNGAADGMQPRDGIAVNAITNIKPYGYTIWGNRTLKNNGEKGNLTATSFLNIRNLISDVKKQAYTVSRQLTFEQNNDVLWANFKSLISSLLDKMLTGYGISGYRIERDEEHEKADEKATVCARIVLYPVYAVEDFYITVVLRDDEVSVN